MRTLAAVVWCALTAGAALAQAPTDAMHGTPSPDEAGLSRSYGSTTPEAATEVLRRVHGFVESSTPPGWVDAATKAPVADLKAAKGAIAPTPGAFRLTSYEWGVTYSGMLRAGEASSATRASRGTWSHAWLRSTPGRATRRPILPLDPTQLGPIRQVLKPAALDDSGAMSAAMIKATRAGVAKDLRPWIDNYLDWISNKEFRLADGTLARNWPQPNTLGWTTST